MKNRASNFKPPTSNDAKPLASISLDLDNKWSYMKTHGDPGWEKFPSYFDVFIPHVLDILDDLNLKITFFIVGKDAALEKNSETLNLLTERGHEVGNHSFHHEPWLHLCQKDHIRNEILEAQKQIFNATGQQPVGFRGPGFSWTPDLLEILSEAGYLYDASTLPTYLGPLARMYYFWTSSSDFSNHQKKHRKDLFGRFKEGLKQVKPYRWRLESGHSLLEIPVTTMPILKLPFHMSYLLYLSKFSLILMSLYLNTALTLCRLTQTTPSFLLHPLDLLSNEHAPELAFFPGINLSSTRKLEIFNNVIGLLQNYYVLTDMKTHATFLLNNNKLKQVELKS
jgi:peptidoglycan/xylan/chitin deacetylase (PgdA/CDA1 family)